MSAICGIVLLGIMNTGKAWNRRQLKSFRYTWNDPTKADCEEVFEAEEDGPEFVRVRSKCYDNNGELVLYSGMLKRNEFMTGLEALSQRRNLEQWNGFCKSNTEKPGNIFQFEASYSDGHNITAQGNNSIPNGYGPAVKEIKAYFKANCK